MRQRGVGSAACGNDAGGLSIPHTLTSLENILLHIISEFGC